MSTLEDAAAVVQMLCQYFVHGTSRQCRTEPRSSSQDSHALVSAQPRHTASHSMQLRNVTADAEGQSCLRVRLEHASASSLASSCHHINANDSSVFSGSASSLDTPDTQQSLNGSLDRSSSCSSNTSSADSNAELCSRSAAKTAANIHKASHEPSWLQSNESLWNQHRQSHTELNPAESPTPLHSAAQGLHNTEAILAPACSMSLSHCEQPATPSTAASAQNAPMLFHDQAVAAAVPAAMAASQASKKMGRATAPRLGAMWIYPIKSCAGARVHAWPLCPTGLLYDRQWALVDADQRVMTQKRLPALARLSPWLDLEEGDRLADLEPSVSR